jgi:hypothetical protein
MSEIRIGPGAQRLLLLLATLAVAAGIAAQLPEAKRYLKIEQM